MDDVDLLDDCLCLAQHHGLPTLLLEWTLNPLVALYFAVKENDDKDGKIWIMELPHYNDRKKITIHLESGDKFPKYINCPLLVSPKPFDPRIVAQSGRFTYTPENNSLEKIIGKKPWESLIYYKIPVKNKKSILLELENMQIHEGTLFPDLDGWARYLSKGGL